MSRVLLILAAALTISGAVAADQPRRSFKLGSFQLQELFGEEVGHGCGCIARYPASQKHTGALLVAWGDEPRVRLRVNGQLKELPSEKDFAGWATHVGERSHPSFHGDGLRVELDLTSTWACPVAISSCKRATYRGTLKISDDGHSVTKRVWADCSC